MKKEFNFKDSAIAFLLCILGVLCASFLLVQIVAGVATSTGQDIEAVSSSSWVVYVNMFLSAIIFIAAFAITCLITKTKNYVTASKLRFKFDYKIFIATILASIVTMVASINATGLFNHLFSYISIMPLTNSVGVPLNNFWQFLLIVFLLGILPAVCEEFLFRGIIYNGFRKKFNVKISVVLSAVLFALIHFSIYKTFYQFILGVILSLLVYYTGTIFYSMVFHFVNNFCVIFLSYITQSGSALQFASWGVKEVLLTLIIFAIGVVAVCLFFAWLKKYSFKHKNYYKLDSTPNALGDIEFNHLDNSSAVSYDEQVIVNQKSSNGVMLLIFTVLIAAAIWSITSFGGFI